MRKKVILVTGGIVLLIVGLAIGFRLFSPVPKPLAAVIPSDAVLYVEVNDFEKSLKEFKDSEFWQSVRAIDIESVLSKTQAGNDMIAQYKKVREDLGKVNWELLVNKFLGLKFAVAVYPFDITLDPGQAVRAVAASTVLVTSLRSDAQFMELMSQVYQAYRKPINGRQEEYRKQTVYILDISPQLKINYTRLNELLIVTLDPQILKRTVDVILDKTQALSGDQKFVEMIHRLTPRSDASVHAVRLTAYGDFVWMKQAFKNLFGLISAISSTDAEREKVDSFLGQMDGIEGFGYTVQAGEPTNSRAVVSFDVSKMKDPFMRETYTMSARDNHSLKFVPKNILFYQWTITPEPGLFWENFKSKIVAQGPEMQGQLAERLKFMRDNFAVDLEKDVIPAFSGEAGGFLEDLDLSGFFPVPKMALFVKVSDVESAKKVVSKLSERVPMTRQSEFYKNTAIDYFLIPLGVSLQPGYCFLGEYLLVSTSKSLLQDAVSAFNDPGLALADDEDFKKLDGGLTQKNNSLIFMRTEKVLEKAQDLVRWGVNLFSVRLAGFQAYQQGEQKRLEDLRLELKAEEQLLAQKKVELETLKNQTVELQAQGLDTAGLLTKQVDLQQEINDQDQKVTLSREKVQALVETLKNSSQPPYDLTSMDGYLQGVVFPVLEGLKEHKAASSRTRIKDGAVEIESFWVIHKKRPALKN